VTSRNVAVFAMVIPAVICIVSDEVRMRIRSG